MSISIEERRFRRWVFSQMQLKGRFMPYEQAAWPTQDYLNAYYLHADAPH